MISEASRNSISRTAFSWSKLVISARSTAGDKAESYSRRVKYNRLAASYEERIAVWANLLMHHLENAK